MVSLGVISLIYTLNLLGKALLMKDQLDNIFRLFVNDLINKQLKDISFLKHQVNIHDLDI